MGSRCSWSMLRTHRNSIGRSQMQFEILNLMMPLMFFETAPVSIFPIELSYQYMGKFTRKDLLIYVLHNNKSRK